MPLFPSRFTPLPLGTLHPRGWLLDQLRLQAESLSGHLDQVWPDIGQSRWFGGDSEGWERAPYWLDGLIPLAYGLQDPVLIAKVRERMNTILDHQQEDGWLGPREMVSAGGRPADENYDLWGLILALKVLVQYHEAAGEERALTAAERCLRLIDRHIDRRPLFNWASFRWFETLIAIYYLYERNPQDWLLELAVKLQAQGFHWGDFFTRWPITTATQRGRWNYMGHVVNNAMAVKARGLWSRISGDPRDREAVYDMLAKLDRHHGQVTGMFSGDECLAGRSPIQGSELCAVVEFAYSLEVLLATLGDAGFGDRLEQIIFNALPATLTPDLWAHQYDQQVNQVECSRVTGRSFLTNGPDSNLYGLEPNFGCCTANFSQGWPKFAASLWLRAPDGLVCAVPAPCAFETEAGGAQVAVEVVTEYPFRETVQIRVTTDRPAAFTLHVRIPAWARNARVQIGQETLVIAPNGTFLPMTRLWSGETVISLTLPMTPEWVQGEQGVGIRRGPLLYALRIGEEWRRIASRNPEQAFPDWEVYPTTAWNVALAVSRQTLEKDITFIERPILRQPFSPSGAPVIAQVKGLRLPGWEIEKGSAGPLPALIDSAQALEDCVLVPYGCTNLRIAEFPLAGEKAS